MAKGSKALIIFMIAVFLFTFITSALASGPIIGHECTGENCLICMAISLRERSVLPMLLLCMLLAVMPLSAALLLRAHSEQGIYNPVTPVCLKVKLSN
ncbi:MAG: hypothetical protein IJY39_03525 [Clostridia bacterium]|nr:hypothetical protein [Clostridia bacterium]